MTSAFESYQKGLLSAEAFGHKVVAAPPEGYQVKAMRLVADYIESRLEKTDAKPEYDVFVVWFSKALVSTTLPDGMYYEVTHNGDKRETYIDAYKKFDNVCVPDEEK